VGCRAKGKSKSVVSEQAEAIRNRMMLIRTMSVGFIVIS